MLNWLHLGAHAPALDGSEWGPFELVRVDDVEAFSGQLDEQRVDVAVLDAQALPHARWTQREGAARMAEWASRVPLLLLADELSAASQIEFAQRGLQQVLGRSLAPDALAREARLAMERWRLARAQQGRIATDLATGLPNAQQLQEHLTHLVALREREPAAMALVLVQIEGLASLVERLGVEAAQVVRRKVAVRLRACLRASDVLASLGEDTLAALLAWIDTAAGAQRVADKVRESMARPLLVAGQEVRVGCRIAARVYPDDARSADELLRSARLQLADAAPIGAAPVGQSAVVGRAAGAAND